MWVCNNIRYRVGAMVRVAAKHAGEKKKIPPVTNLELHSFSDRFGGSMTYVNASSKFI